MSKNSPFVTYGATNHSSTVRQEHDFYATPSEAVDALLSKVSLPANILEPCCGNGMIAKRLASCGHSVIAEDLYDYGYGTSGLDFMKRTSMPEDCKCIVTNFPYNKILPMTLHALELLPAGGLLCSFCKTTFVEGMARYTQLFSSQPFKYQLQFARRVACAPNGGFSTVSSSAVAYAWFIWEKGYDGLGMIDCVNTV